MASNDRTFGPPNDTRDHFITIEDYVQMSCLHYILASRLRDRARARRDQATESKITNGSAHDKNDPATESKITNGSAHIEEDPATESKITNGSAHIKEDPTKESKITNGSAHVKEDPAKITNGSAHGIQVQGSITSPPLTLRAPGLATLSMFEHRQYLELKAKYAGRKQIGESIVELQERQVLAELEDKVEKERKSVSDYLFRNACTTRRNDYFYIHAEAIKYITEVLKYELKYCLQYPQFYSTASIIPLLMPGNQLEETAFSFIKVLLRLGSPPPLLVPNKGKSCVMYEKYDILKQVFPPDKIGAYNIHPSEQHISRDSIAHNLAVKYEADVIITLDSLKTLADNVFPAVEHDWELPIIICEDKGVSGIPYKCIYIERAIPPSTLTVRDKNQLYYNYATKMRFAHQRTPMLRKPRPPFVPPPIPDDIQPVAEEIQAEVKKKISNLTSFEEICEFSEKVCELDTFGVSVPKKSNDSKVLCEEQDPMCDEDQNDDSEAVVNSGPSSSDDDFEDVDDPNLRKIKGLLVGKSDTSVSGGDSTSGSLDVTRSTYFDTERDGKRSCFPQCASPLSNPDSEQECLIIDVDSEEKLSDVPLVSVEKAFDKLFDIGAPGENSGPQKSTQNSTNNDTEIFGTIKRKVRRLSSDGDNDSDSKNAASRESKIICAANKRCRSTDFKTVDRKKSLSPKNITDDESKVQKSKLDCNTVTPHQENPLDMILVSQHKMLNPKDKVDGDTQKIIPSQFIATDAMDQNSAEYPKLPNNRNVQYSLWRLGNLKVLLRSEADTRIPAMGTCPAAPVFLVPKLEYQIKFGFEVSTPSELLRQWVLLHTHPGSRLIRVRMDAAKTSLVMLEEVNLPNLLKNKKDLNPKHATHQLFTTLASLKTSPEGQYLLTHKKGDYTLTLRKAVSTGKHGAYDLHASIKERLKTVECYQDGDSTRKEIPWRPIDPSITLPEQERQHRIPGCFFPTGFRKRYQRNPQTAAKAENEKTSSAQKFSHRNSFQRK